MGGKELEPTMARERQHHVSIETLANNTQIPCNSKTQHITLHLSIHTEQDTDVLE